MEKEILQEIQESIEAKEGLKLIAPAIAQAAEMIIERLKEGGKIIVCGNGGSAADAQHVAVELVGRFEAERRAIPCIAITTNTSNLTAIANDYDFDRIFERQVEALAAPCDVVIGISTSGNSRNVLKALEAAMSLGALTIGLAGERGGRLAEVANICLRAPSLRTCRIQECHLTILHILCLEIEKAILRNEGAR